ncbi:MAG: hypothetical protein M3Y82_07990 [Verrucomicrobiota bacterium]|nr:hypothetical protein [Verrucomicrobiota bacterium]
MEIRERLEVFYQRLAKAQPARNAEEAFLLICRALEEVENEFCPVVEKNPAPKSFDGRMYLPQSDSIEFREDSSWWIETRRHRIAIELNGSFRIYRAIDQEETLIEEFRKSGLNR